MNRPGIPIRPDPAGRRIDVVCLTLAVVILGVLAVDLAPLLPSLDPAKVAVDYHLYLDVTSRWIHGGTYYEPWQVAGPYATVPGAVLYPPPFTLVVAPFLVLPWILWWAIPIGIVAAVTWRMRPRVWAWPLIAFCLWFPGTTVMVVAGNPTMLFVAAMSLATLWSAPAVFILLKPSLLPFALFGIRRRRWWIALGVLALVSLPFGTMWVDYVKTLLNAQNTNGLWYSVGQAPAMALPLAAWVGRKRTSLDAAEPPQAPAALPAAAVG
jgi:hypothetical protein